MACHIVWQCGGVFTFVLRLLVGATIGISVGVLVLILVIVGVVVFAVHRVQRRRVPYKQINQNTAMVETSRSTTAVDYNDE